MFFLLDTNIYLNLLSETETDKPLQQLEEIVFNRRIKLLLPDIIMEEWLTKKEQTIQAHGEESGTSKNSRNAFTYGIARKMQILKDRGARIEAILKEGIAIALNGKTKQLIYDRQRLSLPPYHIKGKPAHRDAGFFFSAINYVKRKKINELYFITNDKGFSDPDKTDLNPGLKPAGCNVHFYTSPEHCFYSLKDLLQLDFNDAISSSNQYIIPVVTQQKDLLSKLYAVLKKTTGALPFVPHELLSRIDPLRIPVQTGVAYSYCSVYTLYTNNVALVDFFSTVDFKGNLRFKKCAAYHNTKANLEKLDFIVDALNRNLVFTVNNQEEGKEVRIAKKDTRYCDCMACSLERLDFMSLIKAKNSPAISPEERMKKAYICAEIGCHKEAFAIYHALYLEAITNNDQVFAYRLQYCLAWLKNLIMFEPEALKTMLDQVGSFNLIESFYEFASSSPFDREVAETLYENKAFDHYTLNIKVTLEQIRDHHRIQLRAGHSNNSHLSVLISQYHEFETFISTNRLPFSRFSEFSKLTDNYIEGLMISASFNKYQVERLENLHDGLLMQLLLKAEPEQLLTHYHRYNREKIPYKATKRDTVFQTNVRQFLSSHTKVFADVKILAQKNSHVKIKYFRYFWNIVTLLSIVDIPETFVKECMDYFLPILKSMESGERMNAKHLAGFIKSRSGIINQEWMQRLFNVMLANPHLVHHELVGRIGMQVSKDAAPLIRTKKIYDQVMEWTSNKRDTKVYLWEYSVFDFFRMMSAPFKKKFSQKINEQLKQKFDHRVFYAACLYDVIPAVPMLQKYLGLYTRPDKIESDPFTMHGERSMPGIDDILQLSLMKNFPLPPEFLAQFKGISPYYDWLTNMENFDYSVFDPLWLIQSEEKHILQKAFAIPALREAVREYLRAQNQPVLARLYTLFTPDHAFPASAPEKK